MKVKMFWQQLPATQVSPHRFVQSLEAAQGVDDLTHLQTELTSETPATRGTRYFQKCINFLTFRWNDTMTLTCMSVRYQSQVWTPCHVFLFPTGDTEDINYTSRHVSCMMQQKTPSITLNKLIVKGG